MSKYALDDVLKYAHEKYGFELTPSEEGEELSFEKIFGVSFIEESKEANP